jgi:predicted kinase
LSGAKPILLGLERWVSLALNPPYALLDTTHCWTRRDRDVLRARIAAIGTEARLYRVTCPEDEAWRRIEKRNSDLRGSLYIARATFDVLKGRFEPLEGGLCRDRGVVWQPG